MRNFAANRAALTLALLGKIGMIQTALTFIALLTPLILIHEFGHFITAKRMRLLVHEFALGFPPRLFAIKRGETMYSVNILPLGGFVKIFGEEGEGEGDPRSFISLAPSRRLVILFAGVLMNVLLAFFLFSLGFLIGIPSSYDETARDPRARYDDIKVQLIAISRGSPADLVGLRMGDVIEEVLEDSGAHTRITEIVQFQEITRRNFGKFMEVSVRRGEERFIVSLTPRPNPPQGEGPLGVMLDKTALVSYPWYIVPLKGFIHTFRAGALIIQSIAELAKGVFVKGAVSADAIAGPIGIAIFTSFFSELGIRYFIQFTALISINLAILNVLPFPALDGGRIFFVLIEKLRGTRVDDRFERLVHSVGFAILLLFMIAVTIKDIARYL